MPFTTFYTREYKKEGGHTEMEMRRFFLCRIVVSCATVSGLPCYEGTGVSGVFSPIEMSVFGLREKRWLTLLWD